MSIFKKNTINTNAEWLNKINKEKKSSKIINYLRTRVFNTFERKSDIEATLAKAKKNWALVEKIKQWEYQVTQKQEMIDGKLSNISYDSNSYYVKIISHYKENSSTPSKPIDEIRYYNNMWHESPVVKRTTREWDSITHYVLDRWTKLWIEFSWYDEKWNKIPNKEQTIRILWENNETIQSYTWEEIENALLVPENNSTDTNSHTLLDVKNVITDKSFTQRIVDRQASEWTKYLIQAWQQFKPENFSKIEKSTSSQEFTDFVTNTPCFINNIAEYNEYAKLRNLKIEELKENWNQTLKFKNSNEQVVREIKAKSNKQEIKSDTFFQLTKDGDIYQSATRDKSGNIISRTINEFRPQRWKASTVTLNYEKENATSWIYLKWKLTDVKDVDFAHWEYLFRNIAWNTKKNNR